MPPYGGIKERGDKQQPCQKAGLLFICWHLMMLESRWGQEGIKPSDAMQSAPEKKQVNRIYPGKALCAFALGRGFFFAGDLCNFPESVYNRGIIAPLMGKKAMAAIFYPFFGISIIAAAILSQGI